MLRQVLLKVVQVIILTTISFSVVAEFKELGKLKTLDPAQKPSQHNVGDTFKALRNGTNYEASVISVSADKTEWKDNTGCIEHQLTNGFAIPVKWTNCSYGTGTGSTKLKSDPWPLSKGKKWKSVSQGAGWSTTRSCKVAGAVKVSTSLGEFDTYKVQCSDSWNKLISYIDSKTGYAVYQTHTNSHFKINNKFETTQFPN